MHLYISESYCVCSVSLTHSLRLCKPHLARHKYTISRRLHWMPFKLESFSHETTCLHATVISTVSVRVACDVSACAAGYKRIGLESARRENWPAGHRSGPVMWEIIRFQTLGRSIGASLIASSLYSIQFSGNLFGNSQYFLQFLFAVSFLFLYFNMYFILFCVFLHLLYFVPFPFFSFLIIIFSSFNLFKKKKKNLCFTFFCIYLVWTSTHPYFKARRFVARPLYLDAVFSGNLFENSHYFCSSACCHRGSKVTHFQLNAAALGSGLHGGLI